MVVNMIQQHGAQEPNSRRRHHHLAASRQAPRRREPRVVHLRQIALCGLEALRKSVEDFLAALGLGLREVRSFHTILHNDRGDAGRHGRDVQRQLALANIHLPIIVVTAHDQPAIREQCLADGAIAYLAKPLLRDRLIATIESAVARRGIS